MARHPPADRGGRSRDLQRVFYEDWFFTTGEALRAAAYFPSSRGQRQVSATDRDRPERPRHAERGDPSGSSSAPLPARARRVWMTTPYFVPDQAITVAMELAAMRGVRREDRPSRSTRTTSSRSTPGGASTSAPRAGVAIYEYVPGWSTPRRWSSTARLASWGARTWISGASASTSRCHAPRPRRSPSRQRLEREFEHDLAQSQRSHALSVERGAQRTPDQRRGGAVGLAALCESRASLPNPPFSPATPVRQTGARLALTSPSPPPP